MNGAGCHAIHRACRVTIQFVNGEVTWRRFPGSMAINVAMSRTVQPVHRLAHQRRALLNSVLDLHNELIEAFGATHACRTQGRRRHPRRRGKVEAGLKRDGFTNASQIGRELLKLLAHGAEAADYGMLRDLVWPGVAIEGGFHQRRARDAWSLDRDSDREPGS